MIKKDFGVARLIINISKMFVYLGLAIGCLYLDRQGYNVFMISTRYSFMYFLFITLLCVAFYNVLILLTSIRVYHRSGTYGEVKMFKGLYKVLCFFAIIIGFFYVLGKLSTFGAFFSMFGGMLLGWSLQAPVSGFAAWIMIVLMRPYKIGDRVQFPAHALMGDIVKFSPMYLTLNQVGGTIGSEEPIGRMINVPNALLFGTVVINCTASKTKNSGDFILDEALFRVTFDSDWDTVEDILIGTAREVTKDIIDELKVEPYVRADTWDYGTLFRLRYMTNGVDRPRIMYEIVKKATKKIQSNKNVDLAIPFIYSFKRGMDMHNPDARTEATENIAIDSIVAPMLENPDFYKHNKEEIDAIMKDIKINGLTQPIMVSRSLKDNTYILKYGEKRLKACELLGWSRIPVIIENKIGSVGIRTDNQRNYK